VLGRASCGSGQRVRVAKRTVKYTVHRFPAPKLRTPRSHVARPRVAVAAGLPVQYMTPFFAYLTQLGTVDLTVLYFTRMGLEDSPVTFTNFAGKVVWDIDL